MAKKRKRGHSLLAIALIPFVSVVFLIGWILFYLGLNKAERRMENILKNKRYNGVRFEVYEQKAKRASV
jgi:hypothetical protein